MALNYAGEKFSLAVHHAAISSKSIQGRLADAFIYNLSLVGDEDLTSELRPRFAALKAKLETTSAKAGEGTWLASALDMSDEEASSCMKELVNLEYLVRDAYEGQLS